MSRCFRRRGDRPGGKRSFGGVLSLLILLTVGGCQREVRVRFSVRHLDAGEPADVATSTTTR